MSYYWVRVFDYQKDRDQDDKGILLDEFYLKDAESRNTVKDAVRNKYSGKSKIDLTFAKPKMKDGIYSIVMESDEFFYNRFNTTIDTFCFWHDCHKPIKGKLADFPKSVHYDEKSDNCTDLYFCSYDCKKRFSDSLRCSEGEWQTKEEGLNGSVLGYIYHIYNRTTDTHYIGQTKYLPFFRWQEHVKSGEKGSISDLVFSVIAEVRRDYSKNSDANQQMLNSTEAWWIAKYKEEGYKTINISNPKITIAEMQQKFDEMVLRIRQEALDL